MIIGFFFNKEMLQYLNKKLKTSERKKDEIELLSSETVSKLENTYQNVINVYENKMEQILTKCSQKIDKYKRGNNNKRKR